MAGGGAARLVGCGPCQSRCGAATTFSDPNVRTPAYVAILRQRRTRCRPRPGSIRWLRSGAAGCTESLKSTMAATPDAYPQLMILIGPATALLFAAGFLWAWTLDRKRGYLLLFAAAYATFATGMGLQVLARPGDIGIGVPATALLNSAAALALATGLLRRSGRWPRPWRFWPSCWHPPAGFCGSPSSTTGSRPASSASMSGWRRCSAALWSSWPICVAGGGSTAWYSGSSPSSSSISSPRPPAARPRRGAGLVPFLGTSSWLGLRLSTAVSGAALAMVLLIAAMVDLQDELRDERDTDRLTGLFNRRGFEERALPC